MCYVNHRWDWSWVTSLADTAIQGATMLKEILKPSILCACLLAASSAQAATYVANRTVGSGVISFSLTTDNTTGVLTAGNITSYAVSITNGINTISFAPGNASLFVFGSALSATSTDLNFDFGGAGNSFLVFNRGAGLGDHYCFETSGCSGAFTSAESFRFGQGGAFVGEQRSGIQTIASVARLSAIPEPGTWAMFLTGFGLIGARIRRRRVGVKIAAIG